MAHRYSVTLGGLTPCRSPVPASPHPRPADPPSPPPGAPPLRTNPEKFFPRPGNNFRQSHTRKRPQTRNFLRPLIGGVMENLSTEPAVRQHPMTQLAVSSPFFVRSLSFCPSLLSPKSGTHTTDQPLTTDNGQQAVLPDSITPPSFFVSGHPGPWTLDPQPSANRTPKIPTPLCPEPEILESFNLFHRNPRSADPPMGSLSLRSRSKRQSILRGASCPSQFNVHIAAHASG